MSEHNQLLRIDYPVGDDTVALSQIRILMALPDVEQAGRADVVQLVLTCPASTLSAVAGEFKRFLLTITPAA